MSVTLCFIFCDRIYVTQSERKALITKNISCIQAATILLFLKEYQLHLTCRKYDTRLCYVPDIVGYMSNMQECISNCCITII